MLSSSCCLIWLNQIWQDDRHGNLIALKEEFITHNSQKQETQLALQGHLGRNLGTSGVKKARGPGQGLSCGFHGKEWAHMIGHFEQA